MTTQEMIERYIYDVVRRLPLEQRDDISRELKGLVDDMMEERALNGKTEQENAEDVLKELGAPFSLAEKYRGSKKYLIGPEYYDQYWFVLKIVLICVAVGMVIAAIVQGAASVLETQGMVLEAFITTIGTSVGMAIANVVMGLVQGFAWVTIIFVVIERSAVKVDIKEAVADAWKPQDLKDRPIPTEKALIKKSDPIAGIVFTIAAIILFNFVPYVMGFCIAGPDGVVHYIPLFNLETLAAMMPFFNICFVLGLIREALRVAIGRHTLWLGVATVVLNMVALGICCMIFFNPAIWNTEVINQAAAVKPEIFSTGVSQMNLFFGYFTRFFGFILIFSFVLDSAISLYKGIRYGR